jgi:transcriptional regulator with XRE-family HTH domain
MRGFTQTRLASIAGMHQTQIAHFESGRRLPGTANLAKLADALGVTMDWLSGRTDFTDVDRAYNRGRRDELSEIQGLLV